MKKILVKALLIMVFASYAQAKEVSFTEIESDPSKYVGKPVAMEGSFLYSEPMRESFTIDDRGNKIEVFYSELPAAAQDIIRSERKYSKRVISVSGTLRQYTNNARSFFITASSIRTEAGASPAPSMVAAISYADILSDPTAYLNTTVTMKGAYLYSDAMRQSFSFDQNGTAVEVLLSDLSKAERDLIISQKKYSNIPVTVSGLLHKYSNLSKKYYINANSVLLER